MIIIPNKTRATLNQIKNLNITFRNGIRRGLQKSGMDIAGKVGQANDGLIKQDMNSPKSGKAYNVNIGRMGRRLRRGGRIHIASAPGEAPAPITGKLRKSVYFLVQGSNQLRIGANTSYAKFLEEGTRNMAPRPYLKKNIDKSRQSIEKNIIDAINSRLNNPNHH